MRILLALALCGILSGAARAADAPDIHLAPRPDGCVRVTVVGDPGPWRYTIVERSRESVITAAPVAFFDEGAALACFDEPFAAGDYLHGAAYRTGGDGSAVSLAGGWQEYAPPLRVYLPMVTT